MTVTASTALATQKRDNSRDNKMIHYKDAKKPSHTLCGVRIRKLVPGADVECVVCAALREERDAA